MKLLEGFTVKGFFSLIGIFFLLILVSTTVVTGCVAPNLQNGAPISGLLETSVTGRIEQLVPIPLNSSYYAVLIHFDDGRIVNLVMRDNITFEFWRGKSVKISFDRSGIIDSVYKVQ